MFSTSQPLGGALGVAVAGTIFFDRVLTHGFTAAFTHTLLFIAAGFIACAALSLALPRTAIAEEDTLA